MVVPVTGAKFGNVSLGQKLVLCSPFPSFPPPPFALPRLLISSPLSYFLLICFLGSSFSFPVSLSLSHSPSFMLLHFPSLLFPPSSFSVPTSLFSLSVLVYEIISLTAVPSLSRFLRVGVSEFVLCLCLFVCVRISVCLFLHDTCDGS